jgi:beta-lactamase regulating signal transducer with metallopeptidase domain
MLQTKPAEIKAMLILHTALLIGQVLFTAIITVITFTGKSQTTSSLNAYPTQLLLLCIGIGIAGYLGGNFLFRKKLEQINSDSKSLSEKFNDYRSACITRWALSEFATLFCIILFFVSGINVLLIVTVALILLFFTTRPSLEKTASDLNVSDSEIEQMNTVSSF